jgi:competence protein ComGF
LGDEIMAKTVKEIEQIQDIIDFICFKHQTNVDDKLIKLYEIRNKMLYYENELAEKDKEIKNLEEKWEILVCDNYELQQTQLFKEDFVVSSYCINCLDELFIIDNIRKRNERKVNKNDKCDTCG